MSFKTITVQNESGQVTSFGFDSEDPTSLAREEILRQRIARGELAKVAKDTKSARPGTICPVEDYQTGLTDERGDLLKSVHGGGLDPDAYGDALGQPSGSVSVDGAIVLDTPEPVGDSHPDAADLTATVAPTQDDGDQDGDPEPTADAEDSDAMKPARARKTAAKRS